MWKKKTDNTCTGSWLYRCFLWKIDRDAIGLYTKKENIKKPLIDR